LRSGAMESSVRGVIPLEHWGHPLRWAVKFDGATICDVLAKRERVLTTSLFYQRAMLIW
ncbi:hypothetical protein Dimus_036558, partial [Dionaea muscipula]